MRRLYILASTDVKPLASKVCLCFIALLVYFWVTDTAYAQSATVTVNTSTTYQTISGIVGDHPRPGAQTGDVDNGGLTANDYALETLSDTNLSDGYAEVALPMRYYEPSNGVYSDTGLTHDSFLQIQRLSNVGYTLIGRIYRMPDWMTGTTNQQAISSGQYSNAAAEIAQILTTLHNNYGVTFKYIAWVEPDNESGPNAWSSTSFATFIESYAGPAVSALGYGTSWLAVDAACVCNEASWATTLLQAAPQYVGALSFHYYGVPPSTDISTFSSVASLGASNSLPVLVPETGVSSSTDYSWLGSGGGDGAFGEAQDLYYVLTYARSTLPGIWEFQDGYDFQIGLVNSNSTITPHPVFYAVKQLRDNLPAGSVMVSAISDNGTVLPLAATSGSNFMTQVINTNATTATITFDGIPNATVNLVETNAALSESLISNYTVTSNTLTISVPAQTVATLTTRSVPSVVQNAALTNYGLGSTPSASSTTNQYGWNLSQVNDGLRYSVAGNYGWISSTANAGSNHTEWIELNLGSSQTINTVNLFPRDDYPNAGTDFPVDFTIDISTDGNSWTSVVSESGYPAPSTGVYQQFTFTPVTAQYVRVNATSLSDNGGGYLFALAEFEVLGSGGSTGGSGCSSFSQPYYYVVNRQTGHYLQSTADVYNGNSSIYYAVASPYTGSYSQWKVVATGDGNCYLYNGDYTSNVLQNTGDTYNSKPGIYYIVSSQYLADFSEWQIGAVGNGYYTLTNGDFTANQLQETGDAYNGNFNVHYVVSSPASSGYAYQEWQFVVP